MSVSLSGREVVDVVELRTDGSPAGQLAAFSSNSTCLPQFLWRSHNFIQASSKSFILAYNLLIPSVISHTTMVRHKKDNFSRGGKKFSNPRPRPVPRDGKETGSSRPPFKAACWDLGHCDPKRCSGKRLMHFGLMRELAIGQKFQGVVVSYVSHTTKLRSATYRITHRPNAKRVVSPADRDLLEQYGAAVVECSWVRVKEVPWSRIGGKCERLCMSLTAI